MAPAPRSFKNCAEPFLHHLAPRLSFGCRNMPLNFNTLPLPPSPAQIISMRLSFYPLLLICIPLFMSCAPAHSSASASLPPPMWVQSLLLQRCAELVFTAPPHQLPRDLDACPGCSQVQCGKCGVLSDSLIISSVQALDRTHPRSSIVVVPPTSTTAAPSAAHAGAAVVLLSGP